MLNQKNEDSNSTRINQIARMVKEKSCVTKISNEIKINKMGWVNWYD